MKVLVTLENSLILALFIYQRGGIDRLLICNGPFIFKVAFSIPTEIYEPASDQ